MTDTLSQPSAADVAEFLRQHPTFFEEHADVFADVRIPHPHSGNAISLGERQLVTLRERQRTLEQRLSAYNTHATANQRTIDGIRTWTIPLLAETDVQALPARVTEGLQSAFGVSVALRLWALGAGDAPWQAEVAETVRTSATRDGIVCGTDTSHPSFGWLQTPPASGARVPVVAPDGAVLGLLVLGANDAGRFTADMGTDFLKHIGALAGAALSRLRA